MSSSTPSYKPVTTSAAVNSGVTVQRYSMRPVHPFSLRWAFDRQRGAFIVQAGARAGACAFVAAAALALGTFGYLRTALFHGPDAADASVTPPLSSIWKTVTPSRMPTTKPSQRAQSAAKSTAKSTAKAAAKSDAKPDPKPQTPVVSATPAAARVVASKSVSQEKSDQRRPGWNYLVVKKLKTRASAEKAREELLRKGIVTTVERNLPGQNADGKYSLVCLSGFDPDTQRQQLDKRIKQLKALNLEPKAYTWRG